QGQDLEGLEEEAGERADVDSCLRPGPDLPEWRTIGLRSVSRRLRLQPSANARGCASGGGAPRALKDDLGSSGLGARSSKKRERGESLHAEADSLETKIGLHVLRASV